MAIDGTPPFKLPPGARWLTLNDVDVLTAAQVLGGTGPFVVPARSRFVIVSLLIDMVDIVPDANVTREVFFVVGPVENDTIATRVPFGVTVPPQTGPPATGPKFPRSAGMVTDLCIPLRAGATISVSGLPAAAVGNNQIICCQGYLEALVG